MPQDTTNLYTIQFKPTKKNKPTRKGGKPLLHGEPIKVGKTDRNDVKHRVFFEKPFSGYTEFFDVPKTEINNIISTIQQASGVSVSSGNYNEDFKPANMKVVYLIIIGIFVFFLVPLLLKK